MNSNAHTNSLMFWQSEEGFPSLSPNDREP